MKEQKNFMAPRWVILLDKKSAEEWADSDLYITTSVTHFMNNEYKIAVIESMYNFGDSVCYTAEDIMIETGALAVHEEWSNGIIVTPDTLKIIEEELYTWDGSGDCFLSDMLTDLERLGFLLKHINDGAKKPVLVSDLMIIEEKGGKPIPLEGNVNKLFSEDIYSYVYQNKATTLWWASIIESMGLFLIILDENYEDEEELDDDYFNTVRKYHNMPKYRNDYYDNFDYDDYGRYYR